MISRTPFIDWPSFWLHDSSFVCLLIAGKGASLKIPARLYRAFNRDDCDLGEPSYVKQLGVQYGIPSILVENEMYF
jgi:hypothetical protein